MRLRSHLIVLVLVAMLPLLLFAIVTVRQDLDERRNILDRSMQDTATALTLAIDGEVRAALAIPQTLAASPLLDEGGGTVFASSEGPGRGASFTVRLPAIEPVRTAKGTPPLEASRALRILVVEDNAQTRQMLGRTLALAGHAVSEAEDGSSAVTLARALLPDIVLIDSGLADGSEVAHRIRSEDARIKLVALTGFGSDKSVPRALASGFDLHLTQPIDLAKLTEVFGSLP